MSTLPHVFFSVSKLSHFKFCPKRSKIELFDKPQLACGKGSIRVGNLMHYHYSNRPSEPRREMLLYKLKTEFVDVFEKVVDGYIHVRGKLDDLIVNDDGSVSLLEVKTTGKRYMARADVEAAAFQLQLYVWLYREAVEACGFRLADVHYVLVYSQKTGGLVKSVSVAADPEIEDKVRYILQVFMGLAPASVPYFKLCKVCPVQVKRVCSWFKMRRGE